MIVTLCLAILAAEPRPALAEQIMREIAGAKADLVFPRFTPEMAAALPKDKTEAYVGELAKSLGALKSLETLAVEPQGPFTRFVYRASFERGAPQLALLSLDREGNIAGFQMKVEPAGDTRHDAYEGKAKLALPFTGEWTARNAARAASNPHFVNPNQRFAVDWMIQDKGKKSFKNKGEKNEDYLCYGADMLAPADGVVVSIVDGVPDNAPQKEMDPYNVIGNSIVLDLGQGEYALFAHAIPGSFKVAVGAKVTRGQVLARVGNSGNSSEPHLHFQLMDAPRLFLARSLPARFADVLVNGAKAGVAWPTEGDRVRAK